MLCRKSHRTHTGVNKKGAHQATRSAGVHKELVHRPVVRMSALHANSYDSIRVDVVAERSIIQGEISVCPILLVRSTAVSLIRWLSHVREVLPVLEHLPIVSASRC